jgi:CUB domain
LKVNRHEEIHNPGPIRVTCFVKAVELSFVDFETEVLRDRVVLYDGDTTGANIIAEFYGTYVTLPVEIRSTGQFMLVVFTTDFSVTRRGFNATYSPYVYGNVSSVYQKSK